LGMVDAMLAERPWVLGEPSLADFGLYGSLSPWLYVGRPIPTGLPHLARWVDRIRSLRAEPGAAQPSGPKRAARRTAK
ncbi:MAG: glutathione S-transferase C-terminal domain-containing protein, partial [Thermoplasmata archaeon]|nr:glutathione S-transferase C-terminal domain-containing protein [Thermoplasmata archaeon]